MKPGGGRPSPAMRCLRCLVVVAGCAAGAFAANAPASAAGADCAVEIAGRVQAHYDTVRDLSADFRQTTQRVGMGSMEAGALDASGEVVLAKPGRMRWRYEAPEPSEVVSDGAGVWIYDPVAREAQHFAVGREFLSGAALQFLLGEGNLLDEFEVRAERCGESTTVLTLHPRKPSSFERVDLFVDPDTGAVGETRVVDLLGNRTHLELEDVQLNQDPDPVLFVFTPPPGTRILEMPGPQTP